MDNEKLHRTRNRLAASSAVIMLAATSAKSTEAKPLQRSDVRKVASYEIYKHEKNMDPQQVNIYQDDQVTSPNTYLTPANIRQSVADIQEFAAAKPDISVNFAAAGQNITLDFEVGPMMEAMHNFYILHDAKSIHDRTNLPPISSFTERVYRHGGMDSYVAPIGNDMADGLNLAKEVCSSLVDLQFTDATMARLNKLFGGQITGPEYSGMVDAVRTSICLSYGTAAATRTASLPYSQYKNIVSNNPYSDKLDQSPNMNFKIDIPVLSQTYWQNIRPMKPLQLY